MIIEHLVNGRREEMKDNEFYRKYANIPLGERFNILSYDFTSPIDNMTFNEVYQEIKKIDDKIRQDIIRKEQLLSVTEPYMLHII